MSQRLLSKHAIREALRALSEDLETSGDSAQLVVGGGAAIALAHDARDATKDVDAYVAERRGGRDTVAVRAAARRVAAKMDLPDDWLNDGFKGYIRGGALGAEVFRSGSLVVNVLCAVELLAMKLSASRDDVDVADARLLLTKVTGTKAEVWARVEELLYPGRELTACYVFEDLWESLHGSP